MTFGPHDLRLARALADQQLDAARRMRISLMRRPSARGSPPEQSGGCVALRRPAHSGAAGGN